MQVHGQEELPAWDERVLQVCQSRQWDGYPLGLGLVVEDTITELFMIVNTILNSCLQGLVSEDTVKDCVSRLFMVRMKLGEFDPAEMNPYKKYVHLMLVYIEHSE